MIYIDHDAALNIAKQTFLSIIFTNKLNFRLIRIFDYLQRFNLNIRHKSNKQHIVLDVLSRLTSTNIIELTHQQLVANDELDIFFTTSLIEMNDEFRNKIFKNYQIDLNWQKINATLSIENGAKLSFYRKNELIYRSDDFIIESHAYELKRLCIFHSIIEDILKMIHDENHLSFVRCYEKIIAFYYIRDLSRYFRDYFKHCPKCLIFQIWKHQSYGFLQSILTSSISFHIIIINFILILSLFDNFDILMSVICKFLKRVILISDNVKWFVEQWEMTLLNRLNVVDWDLSKIIIFDRNRKFLSELWIAIFKRLNVRLMYFIVYHSQTNEQSERINQTIEITFRYYMIALQKSSDWLTIFKQIQCCLNNAVFTIIKKIFNEMIYDFISLQTTDLLKSFAINQTFDF